LICSISGIIHINY